MGMLAIEEFAQSLRVSPLGRFGRPHYLLLMLMEA